MGNESFVGACGVSDEVLEQQPREISSTVKWMRHLAGLLFVFNGLVEIFDYLSANLNWVVYNDINDVIVSRLIFSMLDGLSISLGFLVLTNCSTNKSVRIGTLIAFIYSFVQLVLGISNCILSLSSITLGGNVILVWNIFSIILLPIIWLWGFGIIFNECSDKINLKSWISVLICFDIVFVFIPYAFKFMMQNFAYFNDVKILLIFFNIIFMIALWKFSHSELFEGKHEDYEKKPNLLPNSRYLISVGVTIILSVISFYLLVNYFYTA